MTFNDAGPVFDFFRHIPKTRWDMSRVSPVNYVKLMGLNYSFQVHTGFGIFWDIKGFIFWDIFKIFGIFFKIFWIFLDFLVSLGIFRNFRTIKCMGFF